ncbi:WRKY transcription factor 44-like isoform X2 [Tripterygium wilfordii]|uniref:WRKY transcription factor 44-like isoform X2 n=1 Tax=Tripterygium wilfordii TaxID=458696 RepID=UPI0018F83650|nr:WRKY transcription factor 44-like isoform X2 [Tripterygium wilfordii]
MHTILKYITGVGLRFKEVDSDSGTAEVNTGKRDLLNAERIVVTKPVATRPTRSTFRSFSELLSGAIDDPPHETCSEIAVAAIRPKTVRFNQMASSAPGAALSSQAEFSETLLNFDSKRDVYKLDKRATLVYKPQAKFVSKTTVSLLANMGNFNSSYQEMLPLVETHVPCPNKDIQNLPSQLGKNLQIALHTETDRSIECENIALQNLEEVPNAPHAANGDRPSYDGYNWRKYGQKQVKGSEYPRSYYKCTHPNCPVKKKVERSFDGQIAEIVYKGEHNHSKPQPPNRNSSATHGLGSLSDPSAHETNVPSWDKLLDERNEGSKGRVENRYVEALSALACQDRDLLSSNPVVTGGINTGAVTSDNFCGISADCDEGSNGQDGEPRSKRRKSQNHFNEGVVAGEDIRDPHIAVQSSVDSEILGDGFRWRKYGQKVVKGNPYPRCTSLSCNVRKHVERASDDPRAFITTYEGKHNHEMPIKNKNLVSSESNSQATTS